MSGQPITPLPESPGSSEADAIRLVYIVGSGHCGSTLLDLILNGHSRLTSLGEIGRLRDASPATRGESTASTFWDDVRRTYESSTGRSLAGVDLSQPRWRELRRWSPEQVSEWAGENASVLRAVRAVSGADILTDSTKRPHRLWLLHQSRRFDLRVIHLVRDGRAVVNSYARKYGRFSPGFRRWLSSSLHAVHLRRSIGRERWLRIRYEDLATRPEDVVRTVCDHLGLEFEPPMLQFRQETYHGLGGNRMQSGRGRSIAADTRWKTELSSRHRVTFAVLGGWLNRAYGYPAFR